jgi:hypothetical protein
MSRDGGLGRVSPTRGWEVSTGDRAGALEAMRTRLKRRWRDGSAPEGSRTREHALRSACTAASLVWSPIQFPAWVSHKTV